MIFSVVIFFKGKSEFPLNILMLIFLVFIFFGKILSEVIWDGESIILRYRYVFLFKKVKKMPLSESSFSFKETGGSRGTKLFVLKIKDKKENIFLKIEEGDYGSDVDSLSLMHEKLVEIKNCLLEKNQNILSN